MIGCCDSRKTARLTVHDCFDRGLGTRRLPPLPVAGEPVSDRWGLWAAFSVAVDDERLADLRFRSCSCTTLVAYCQALVDLSRGRPLAEVSALDASTLVARLPGVPRHRRDRAALALAALRAALVPVSRVRRATA